MSLDGWRAVGLVLLAACYSASPALNVPCGPNGECPSGQQCDTGQTPPTCVLALMDASVAGDGPPIDAPPLECTVSSDCTNAGTPVCDDSQHVCRACVADAECDGVCTEYNGQCIGNGQAIFVSPAGADGGNCTANMPCRTFSYAFQQLTANRRVIRVGDGMYMRSGNPVLNVTDTSGRIVFSGEDRDPAGAVMTAVSNGVTTPPIVSTDPGTDVVVEGITLTNADTDAVRSSGKFLVSRVAITNNADRGIQHQPNSSTAELHVWDSLIEGNSGDGVFADRGSAEVLRSTVHNNNNGGISVDGVTAVTIIGSIVTRNGNGGSSYGGIRTINVAAQQVVISFDTIAFNRCNGTGAAPGLSTPDIIDVTNSIATDNVNDATVPRQICDTCTASYSLFSGVPLTGTGNITGPAQFIDAVGNNFHLMASSPARDAADPAANVRYDIDGNSRPLGAGFDIGADEIMP